MSRCSGCPARQWHPSRRPWGESILDLPRHTLTGAGPTIGLGVAAGVGVGDAVGSAVAIGVCVAAGVGVGVDAPSPPHAETRRRAAIRLKMLASLQYFTIELSPQDPCYSAFGHTGKHSPPPVDTRPDRPLQCGVMLPRKGS